MHKRTKALAISERVKTAVWLRDKHCIICGDPHAEPNAHFIPRSQGGLGIEQNVVTLCRHCHHKMDHTIRRKEMLQAVKNYLDSKYPGFSNEQRVYKK